MRLHRLSFRNTKSTNMMDARKWWMVGQNIGTSDTLSVELQECLPVCLSGLWTTWCRSSNGSGLQFLQEESLLGSWRSVAETQLWPALLGPWDIELLQLIFVLWRPRIRLQDESETNNICMYSEWYIYIHICVNAFTCINAYTKWLMHTTIHYYTLIYVYIYIYINICNSIHQFRLIHINMY